MLENSTKTQGSHRSPQVPASGQEEPPCTIPTGAVNSEHQHLWQCWCQTPESTEQQQVSKSWLHVIPVFGASNVNKTPVP